MVDLLSHDLIHKIYILKMEKKCIFMFDVVGLLEYNDPTDSSLKQNNKIVVRPVQHQTPPSKEQPLQKNKKG